MVLFKQSDEDILCENLNMIESENAQLRDQLEDMERELDFKEQRITEMEAELKLLRNEREQFEQMCVRLEIQTKELGMIMRDQKESGGNAKKRSPLRRAGSGQKTNRTGELSSSGAITGIKNYFQRKLGRRMTTKK